MSQKEELLWDRIAKLTRERDEARTERDYLHAVLESIVELCDEDRPTDVIVEDVRATANVQ